ncbi:hypothetical protein TD95_002474 [Thielaviopsis punctulata]|uniref:Uncharacterized protein n=1 Tax=Thielaviopsis punctulata TaxID=72032 RepID=A0A0F4ZA57_9PEZI|nr:hypothetical protein TD95_002474 [Thielaviopsis punctulata]
MRLSTDSRDRPRDFPPVAPLNLRRLRSFRNKSKITGNTPTSATTPVGEHITSPLSAGLNQSYHYRHGPSASVSAAILPSVHSPLEHTSAVRLRNHSVSAATPRHFNPARPTVHQQHGFSQNVNYIQSADIEKRYQETHVPKSFEDSIFINGLAAHPTFVPGSEQPTALTHRSNLVLSPGDKSRVQLQPALRSPGGHFYSSPSAAHPNVKLDTDAASSWRGKSSHSQLSPDSNESHQDFLPTATTTTRNRDLAPAPEIVPSRTMNRAYQISPPSSPDQLSQSRIDHSNASAMRNEDSNVAKLDESGRQVFRVAQGQGMRWDAMTGEPTLGPGRSAQVKPAEYAHEFSKSPSVQDALGSNPVRLEAMRLKSPPGAFGSRGQKVRVSTETAVQSRIPQKSPQAQIPSPQTRREVFSPTDIPEPKLRPEWKGGSGRTAIVNPVRDIKTGAKPQRNPAVLNLASPVRSETSRSIPVIRRMAPSKNQDKGRVTPVSSPKRSSSHGSNTLASPVSDSSSGTGHMSSNYPTPPSSVDRKTSHVQAKPPYGSGSSAQQHDGQHHPSQAQRQLQMQMQMQMQQSPSRLSNSSIHRKPMPSSATVSSTGSPVSENLNHHSSSMTERPQRAPRSSSPSSSASRSVAPLYIPPAASFAAPSLSTPRSPVESTPDSPVYEPARPPSWVQPPSRFSVTTVGTSDYTTSPELNAVSDDSIPTIPEDLSEPAYIRSSVDTSSESVLSRPRPKFDQGSGHETDMPIKISLGSWRTGMSRETNDNNNLSTAPSSSLTPTSASANNSRLTRQPSSSSVQSFNSTFNSDTISMHTSAPGVKALPPAPPESKASDRVTHLNALLSALANRRININRSISKITEMMPRDNLMARPEVMKRREQEKVKVQALRDELAEVQREEYELGIKLHRAYKRQAREGNYDNGSALWVRRAME